MSFMPHSSPPSSGLLPEQQNALAEFSHRQHLRILAYAGAGKSYTAAAIAEFAASRWLYGYYWCFNVSTRVSMERRLKNTSGVIVRGTGQMACAHAKSRGYSGQQLDPEINFRCREHLKPPQGNGPETPESALAIDETLKRFYRSVDFEPAPHHVPYFPSFFPSRRWADGEAEQIADRTWRVALWIWHQQQFPGNALPMGGAALEKLWSLQCSGLGRDFVIIDEAQDTAPPVLALLARLGRAGLQVVLIGDSHQAIYGWRGAENALDAPWIERTSRLSQTFRFGAGIAEHVNPLLQAMGEMVPLIGNPNKTSQVLPAGASDVVIARTNAGVFTAASEFIEAGRSVCAKGCKAALAAFLVDVKKLQNGQKAEQVHDLMGFTSWQSVVDFAKTPPGADLSSSVGLVEKFGLSSMWNIVKKLETNEVPGGALVTTCHKAKGDEWPVVRISNDFEVKGEKIPDEQRRLFYVAATRAQHRLIMDPLILSQYSR